MRKYYHYPTTWDKIRIKISGLLWKLKYTFKTMGKEKMLCPLRESHPVPWSIPFDCWQKRGRDRCCSFCGSWHPSEFVNFCDRIIMTDGMVGTIDLNDSRNKIYMHRDWVHNSDDGAIKFKLAHLNERDIDLVNKALKISNRIFMAQMDRWEPEETKSVLKKVQDWLERWRANAS